MEPASRGSSCCVGELGQIQVLELRLAKLWQALVPDGDENLVGR